VHRTVVPLTMIVYSLNDHVLSFPMLYVYFSSGAKPRLYKEGFIISTCVCRYNIIIILLQYYIIVLKCILCSPESRHSVVSVIINYYNVDFEIRIFDGIINAYIMRAKCIRCALYMEIATLGRYCRNAYNKRLTLRHNNKP